MAKLDDAWDYLALLEEKNTGNDAVSQQWVVPISTWRIRKCDSNVLGHHY